jgi:rubrerythrin
MNESEPKSSPFLFDVYECPQCGNAITASVYRLIRIDDVPCPSCQQRQISEYVLRKAKESTSCKS